MMYVCMYVCMFITNSVYTEPILPVPWEFVITGVDLHDLHGKNVRFVMYFFIPVFGLLVLFICVIGDNWLGVDIHDLCTQVKRSNIRKGMVMLHPKINPKAVWEYKGEVLVLHHPTTISAKYQAMGKI